MIWSGQKTELSLGEIDYWKKYVWLTEFGIKPHELELIPIEDLNAMWVIHECKQERKKHDAFKQSGQQASNSQPQGIGS